MPSLKISVQGLSGEEEARRVERALAGVAGVYGVVVNPEERCIEVDYEDDEIGIQRLIALVRSAGFEASVGG